MGGVVIEEKAISRSRYLDLVYSQASTLYDLIPHAPHPTTDPSRPATEPPVDGILGSIQTQTMEKYTKNQTQSAAPLIQPTPPPKTTPPRVFSSEVNAVQSTKSFCGKKKGKNKSKKSDNKHEGNRQQNTDDDSKNNRKVKY